MKILPIPYVQKPLAVQAVRVTAENMVAVAEWCNGSIEIAGEGSKLGSYIKVKVVHPLHSRQSQAYVGDWVLLSDSGYKVYNNRAFERTFEQIPDVTLLPLNYPEA